MANPFETKFDSSCDSCGSEVEEGDVMYAHEELFICEICARANGNVCNCGNYKKDTCITCFECFNTCG